MNILVSSNNYPSKKFPNYGAFVYNLLQEFAKKNSVTVIAPFKIHQWFHKEYASYGLENCKVFRPTYLSLTNKIVAQIDLGKVSSHFNKRAVENAVKNLEHKPDVVYCHFLVNAFHILDYVEKNKIPLIVASGESTYNHLRRIPKKSIQKLKNNLKHLVCVSEENKQQLIDFGFSPEIMTVVPNAVNYDLFKPGDKENCKKKLGISPNKFVVGFIGHFIERKGPNRLLKAIST